ncbi:MAG: 5-dehydro-2-deoxygluconokinase [Candidatus Xenobia bacterium]
MKPLDLISVGRCGVDLYCDQIGSPLADGQSTSMYVGNCPANVAVGASRLGLKVAMLTRVGHDAPGEFVLRTLEREGIDVSHVARDPDAQTPVILAGIQPPDRFSVTFYRDRPADLAIARSDFDDAWIESSQAILVSGHSMSRPDAAQVLIHLLETAKRVGTKIVYDIDFRACLWHHRYPSRELQKVLPYADVVVGTAEEFQTLAGLDHPQRAVALVRARTPGLVILKLGAGGAQVGDLVVPAWPVQVLNTLGAGDSFIAGFLSGWLRGMSLEDSLKRANANGAMVVTRHGCAPAMAYAEEMEYFLAHPQDFTELERLHRKLSRPRATPVARVTLAPEDALQVRSTPATHAIHCRVPANADERTLRPLLQACEIWPHTLLLEAAEADAARLKAQGVSPDAWISPVSR